MPQRKYGHQYGSQVYLGKDAPSARAKALDALRSAFGPDRTSTTSRLPVDPFAQGSSKGIKTRVDLENERAYRQDALDREADALDAMRVSRLQRDEARGGPQMAQAMDFESPMLQRVRKLAEDEQVRKETALTPLKVAVASAQHGGRRQIQQVVGPDGTPSMVSVDPDTGDASPVKLPEGVRPNRPVKTATAGERQTLAYFNRAKDAIGSAELLEPKVGSMGLGFERVKNLPGVPDFLVNALLPKDQQAYRQAQRAFTEARLRKESGAAIPTSEYENDERTYFRQPGDTPETLKQKAAGRRAVLEGLKFSSGRAYDEFYGGEPDASAGAGAPNAGSVEYDYVPGKGLVPRTR